MTIKRALQGLAAIGAVGTSSALQAQSVQFQGTAAACFYTTVVCTPGSTPTAFMGLLYDPGAFNQLIIPNVGQQGLGTGTGNNFGTLELFAPPSGMQIYAPENFFLRLTFSVPVISGTADYVANLAGVVVPDSANIPNGGVFVNFDNTFQTFAYVEGGQSGTFSLDVNDESVNADACTAASYAAIGANCLVTPGDLVRESVPITGNIIVTTTPEPSTLLLFGIGGLALVPVVMRRRNR